MLDISPAITAYILIITAILGLCVGSFVNCAAWRITHDESVLKGRSHCPECGHELSALDLIPIFSWLFLKGRCRYCGKKILARYPLSELVCAIAFVTIVLHYGITLEGIQFLVLASILLCLSLTDLDDQIIPNGLIIAGIVVRVVYCLFAGNILQDLLWSLIGGLVIAVPLIVIVLIADKVMGRESMGGGDIKLFFVVGLYFPWQQNVLLLIIACIIGIVLALISMHGKIERNHVIPFGPSIALATWLTMLFGGHVLAWYLGFFL